MRGLLIVVLVQLAAGLALGKPPASQARASALRRPCDPRTEAYRAAATELKLIDGAVRALAPGANPGPLASRIERLVEGPCFAILDGVDLPRSSGLALKTYWESGGDEHLSSVLDLGGKERYVWIPPSPRRALTLETAPKSPLRALLCPAADVRCGIETAGWAMRAEETLRRAAESRDEPSSTTESCTKSAQAAKRSRRFTVFRECLERTQPRQQEMLPIGRIRAPKQGWLIVKGRRGHYQFCDEVRAYDLATGSYYRVGSCSGLALQRGGSVDHRRTDQQRRAVVEQGHLPVEALRESAWMMLLLDEVDRDVRPHGFGTQLPSRLEVVAPANEFSGALMGGFSFWFSSAQTHLSWKVVGEACKSGTLTYPEDGTSHAGDHAVKLLRIAEEAAQPGCPEVPPPVALASSAGSLRANRLDSDATSLTRAAGLIEQAWKEAVAKQSDCAAQARDGARPRR